MADITVTKRRVLKKYGAVTNVYTSGASGGGITTETDPVFTAWDKDYNDLINKPTVVSDHGGLTGLTDDDHTQYHNDARGDVRYLKLAGGSLTGAVSSNSNISTTGSVGIGTASPSKKLDIVGGSVVVDNSQGYEARNASGIARRLFQLYSDNNVYLDAADGDFIMRTKSGTSVATVAVLKGTTQNVGIGVASPSYKLDVGGAGRFSDQLISSLATGTAPFAVTSTTVCTNLNADKLDGYDASAFAAAAHSHLEAFQTLTDSTTVSWNLTNGVNATVTLAGNRTLAITNASSGINGVLIVKQDSTGSRTLTLPSGSKVINGGTLTLSTAANAVDILTFVYDGTNYYWSIGKNYA